MKISEAQLNMLLDIAKHSLRVANAMAGWTNEQRHQLVNEIISQQSDELVEIGEVKCSSDKD